jgi:hypothetical protein
MENNFEDKYTHTQKLAQNNIYGLKVSFSRISRWAIRNYYQQPTGYSPKELKIVYTKSKTAHSHLSEQFY